MSTNWAQIGSGATFQALVNILLLHEDPATRPFTKPGPDGAIDALVVGSKVYQAKYHKHATASDAFADARAEAKRIEERKAPGSKWAPAWSGVSTWVLVTNAPFGPEDDQKWRDEIVPLFAKLGLTADYWVESQLEERLAARPDVEQAFFGGKVRFFVSLAEWFELLRGDAVLERAYDLPLEGREEVVDRIRHFVKHEDARLLLVHGPGGGGKSRLQAAAALTIWQEGLVDTVLCGTPHLPTTADWYLATIPEAPALVILDEPDDPAFIERFLFELKTRVKHWKVIVTARTPRDPVIAKLTDPLQSVLAEPIELKALEKEPAFRLAEGLVEPLGFSEEQGHQLTRWLVEVCGRPVWMTMAVRVLEENRDLSDLPTDRFGVARRYVEEMVEHSPKALGTSEQVRALLHWLAVYQPVNRQDEDIMAFLAARTGLGGPVAVDALIGDLERRRVVTRYGVEKRMVELRPDVLREHLLVDLLTYEDAGARRPSQAAHDLAAELVATTMGKDELPALAKLIATLGNMELRLEGAVRLLDPVADALVRLSANAPTTLEQQRALELAGALAFFRPGPTAAIARHLRMSDAPEASIEFRFFWKKRMNVVERAEVVSELPWLLASAARGSETAEERRAILDELLAHVELEFRAGPSLGRRNDGKRAKDLVPRILHERYGYRSSFHGEAAAIAGGWLTALATGDALPSPEAFRVLVGALLALERRDDRPGEEPFTLQIETRRLAAKGEPGQVAMSIRERLWSVAADPRSPEEVKAVAWGLLDDLHGDLNRLRDVDPDWREFVRDDLERCIAVARRPGVSLRDLQAARGLCDWHIQFEDEKSELRGPANTFDAAYRDHPAVAPYVELFGADRVDDEQAYSRAVAVLTASGSVEAIEDFFCGAQGYTATHSEDWRTQKVRSFAWTLGHERGEEPHVLEFALQHLRQGAPSPFFGLALSLVNGLLHAQRTAGRGDAVAKTLDDCAAATNAAGNVAQLVFSLYVEAGPRMVKAFLREDCDFLLRHDDTLRGLDTGQYFFVLGHFLPLHPGAVLPIVHTRFDALAHEEKARAVAGLWRGFFDTYPPVRDTWTPPPALVDDLLDLTALVPDVRDIGGNVGWEIEQICKRIEKKPIAWLVERIERRREAFWAHGQRSQDEVRPRLVWLIPDDDSALLRAVATIPDEAPSAETVQAMEALLAFNEGDLASSHGLPELLVRLDPHGRVLPGLLATKLADPLGGASVDQVVDSAEHARAYAIGTAPWRTIALAACRRVEVLAMAEKDRVRVYSCLTPRHSGPYGGAIDEIHPRWQAAVDDANAKLKAESEPELRAFWEWLLRCAEADLEHEKGRLEEELRSLGVR